MPKDNADMPKAWALMHASFWTEWTNLTWITSKDCARPLPSNKKWLPPPRSTVGILMTRFMIICDYYLPVLVLLFLDFRQRSKRRPYRMMIEAIKQQQQGNRVYLLVNFKQHSKQKHQKELNILLQKGFTRVAVWGSKPIIGNIAHRRPSGKTDKELKIFFIINNCCRRREYLCWLTGWW